MLKQRIKSLLVTSMLVAPIAMYSLNSEAGRGGGGGGAVVVPAAVEWTSLLGGVGTDYSTDAIDIDASGNVAIAGYTFDALSGFTNQGGMDAIIGMYDADGALIWQDQVGTANNDVFGSVKFDINGDLIVSSGGITTGEVVVMKYGNTGGVIWSNQYGNAGTDRALDITTDSVGNIYICGSTTGVFGTQTVTLNEDAFLMKLDTNGNMLWVDQFGSTGATSIDDDCRGVVIDSNDDVYITGYTDAAIVAGASGVEFFIRKYDSLGNVQWTTQRDSVAFNRPTDIAIDNANGNIYVTGWGGLDGPVLGRHDTFVVGFDANGVEQWAVIEQSDGEEWFNGVAVDGNGVIHVAGYTNGSLAAVNAGDNDIVYATYDAAGSQLSIVQNNTVSFEVANGIAVNPAGTDYYIMGHTDGDLDAEVNNGLYDLFVTRNRP